MFVQLVTTDGKNVAVNPMAITLIIEQDTEVTAIETTDGHEYTVAEGFRDVKVKLESSLNERYRHKINH